MDNRYSHVHVVVASNVSHIECMTVVLLLLKGLRM